jgi:hypothetical protein
VSPRGAPELPPLAVSAVALYGLLGFAFVFAGLSNGDEGYYLYAGRLVYRGALPWSDFAYPQMPLMAYVYGLPQLLVRDLYLGRATSVVLLVGALLLCVRTARQLAGPDAAAGVAVLVLAAPLALYHAVLVKTYAPAAFLLAATLAALVHPGRREVWDPLAVAAVSGLALARTSGLPYAALVVAWCVLRAPTPVARRRSLLVAASGAALAGALLLADPHASRFFLGGFHQIWWYGATPGTRLRVIFGERIPELLMAHAPYWLLLAAGLAAVWRAPDARDLARRTPALWIALLGSLAFLATHLFPGQFGAVEYFAPLVPVLVTLGVAPVALALTGPRAMLPAPTGRRVFYAGIALIAAVTLFRPSVAPFLVAPGSDGSLAATNAVADFVREHTGPGDEVLALWSQGVNIAADRDAPAGVSMGVFSYVDMPGAEAAALHFVNAAQLAAMLRARQPAAVVLSEVDRNMLRKAGTLSKRRQDPRLVLDPLEANYALAYTGRGQGPHGPEDIRVYLRRESGGEPSR